MAKDARSACVRAINAYYQDHLEKGAAPLVVCCRSEEYRALQTRMTLQQAVAIQPLTDDQIEAYLQGTKGMLEALRQALHNDPGLNELAHRPLMLSIFTLAYQGAEVEELPSEGTREAQQQQVFATYVERMLQRRAASHYTPDQTKHWLAWLAQQMALHSQTEFYLEWMQPDWLQKGQLYRLYRGISGALLTALLVGLVGLLLGPSMVQIFDYSIGYMHVCPGGPANLPTDVTSGIASGIAIAVLEIPGDPGMTNQPYLYLIMHLSGQGADLVPATASFPDVNGDGKPDLQVTVYEGTNPSMWILFHNGTTFVPKLS